MKNLNTLEYIWLDGNRPVSMIRSKTRVTSLTEGFTAEDIPRWGYDGSSTYQATTANSDLELVPVNFVKDPLLGDGAYLVLCEVYDLEGNPHETNERYKLRQVLEDCGSEEPWFGFEQEYTLFRRNIPLGWPEHGFPAPQGPYYCGVGTEQIFGRDFVMDHMEACLDAGIQYFGANAEVMPGQWEFQLGYRGIDGENMDAVNMCDHLWLARWLMHRISEDYEIHVSLHNKPVKGNWNGAGMHTNFSTKRMRTPGEGKAAIDEALERLSKVHKEHIAVYGEGLAERLTGQHETAHIDHFSVGSANRGCSIRIPNKVLERGYGYIEDRRPGANADPYQVARRMLQTVCVGVGEAMALK